MGITRKVWELTENSQNFATLYTTCPSLVRQRPGYLGTREFILR